ncbi:hypothetical protein CKN86_06360 [Carnobacterium divergens]|uniref:helix-turn-helix domain-containing protein n=1 Tax=Carnobacterium divergens TaxID=2748 RepID=UPI000D44F1FA|nr:helix-turn-helix domain-containing protein [Carnobacterium divergens]MCO6017008.1 helix-turn-helix domain-containing protein [Carnobacterium divergens]TFI62459.1 hypothetical protein CKN62_06395 [Carnobacterium divergens]TFI89661.1 hypothetical protein CKN84_06395 [Carnobacterium divergens]TFJ04716.1 hypothetical protein CKN86_06360 [Carnobacterium divergens]TFJ06206.1 hypothetical protein CKN65_06400 [Carnobacterium divergens]
MEPLMDKVIDRKIKLLKRLNSNEVFFSLAELAEFLDLSVKTTILELTEAKEYLEKWRDEIQLIKQKTNYKLIKKNTFNIEIVYSDLKKKSFFYLFYTTLFFEKHESATAFSRNYFFSYSHFYKKKMALSHYLKNFDLNFENEPLKIIGKEIKIRFFSYHFFWEHYESMNWPFLNINQSLITRQLKEAEALLKVDLTEPSREQIVYWIGIQKTRIETQHILPEIGLFHEIAAASPSYKRLVPWLKKIIATTTNELTEYERKNEMEFLYFIFFLIAQPQVGGSLIEDIQIEQLPDSNLYKQSQGYLKQFYRIFQVTSSEEVHLMEGAFFEALFYHNYLNDPFISYLQFDEKLHTVPSLFKEKFQAFYLVGKRTKASIDTRFYHYIQQLLSTIIESNHYRPRLYVNLISKKGKIEEKLLIQEIKKMPYNLEINKKAQELSDCIISDSIEIKENNGSVFYWNSSPTKAEWEKLAQQLQQVEKNKIDQMSFLFNSK